MCTLTSRRNALASHAFRLAFFISVCCLHIATGANIETKQNNEKVIVARSKISEFLKSRDDFPEESIKSINIVKPLLGLERNGRRLLIPAIIRFNGISNSYCRIFTFDSEKSIVFLVDVPTKVNFDECRYLHNVHYIDINDDNVLDIVASLSVKSNSFDGYVDEQVIYISNDSASGYCFSEVASNSVKPKDMATDETVRRAVALERNRLGILKFSCDARDIK